MTKIKLLLAIILLIFLSNFESFAAFCITPTHTSGIVPQVSAQTTAVYTVGNAPLFTFTAEAGATYNFRTCGLSGFNTYLRIYNSSETMIFAVGGNCGTTLQQTDMIWACPASGSYSLLLTGTTPCNPLASNAQLSYWRSGMIVPNSGSNSYTGCTGVLNDSGGATNYYVNSSNGYTVLYPSFGNLVSVSGTCQTESGVDFLRIYNGVGLTGTLLWQGSGYTTVPTIVSSTGPLTIRFTSDNSASAPGFTLNLNCVPCTIAAPTSVSASSSQICPGQSPGLSAISSGGLINWYTTPSGGISLGSSASGSTFNVNPLITTTYYAEAANSAGCVSTSRIPITVNVNSVPAAPTNVVALPSNICVGQSTNLSAVSSGNSIQWYTTPTGGSILGTSASSAAFSVSPTITTTYYAESVNSLGCSSATRVSVTVFVNSIPPSPTNVIAANSSICPGYGASLNGISPGDSIHWYTASSGGTSLGSSASGFYFMVTPLITTTYYAEAVNTSGCASAIRIPITVNVYSAPAAPTSISVSSSTICSGQSTDLSAISSGNTIGWYVYPSGGIALGTSATGSSFSVSPSITTTYYAEAINSFGCASTARIPITITVNPVPSVNAGPDVSICTTNSTTLNGTVSSGLTSLNSVLSAINANQATLTSSIPTPYGFVMDGAGGVNSNYILDGGNDMYDWGNEISTNLGQFINYSDNTVVSNAAFGTGGQYFTRVIGAQGYSTTTPTIFYWAADLYGVSSVSITGNNGADNLGYQDMYTFAVSANGITYTCFLKIVYGAGMDPSINQLFMIPQPNNASQSMGFSTDDGSHMISGLTGFTRMYYMLYAGNIGALISLADATTIAQTFANIIPSNETYAWSSIPTGFTSNVQNPTVAPSTTTTYTLSTTVNGCTNSDSVIVQVNSPNATLTTASSTACNGTQVNLGGNVTASGAWSLNLSNGQTISGTGNSSWSTTVAPISTTTYSISSLTDSTSCPSTLNGTTTVTLPTIGSELGNNNESATCLVNQNGWIHFYHSSGRLLASINSLGQNLGDVTVTSYVDTLNQIVPACDNLNNSFYSTTVLQRHWVITPTNQPALPVQVRLPFKQSEVSTLESIANFNPNPFDDVILMSDLKLSKYSGPNNVDNDALNNCSQNGGNSSTTIYAQNYGGLTSSYSNVNNAEYSDFTIPNFSEFWLHGSVDNSPLPITLVEFTDECIENKGVLISWVTATESNTEHFELEKSTDGINWNTIATLNAAVNSTSINNYSYLDEHVQEKTVNYYRLLQVDLNGEKQEYGPIGSECNKLLESIDIYPNPTDDLVNVFLSDSYDLSETSIRLLDMNGRELDLSNTSLEMNGSKITLSLAHFELGCYFIECKDAKNALLNTVKIVRK